jgi:hypothetical protein
MSVTTTARVADTLVRRRRRRQRRATFNRHIDRTVK